jgi:hypothetical protein
MIIDEQYEQIMNPFEFIKNFKDLDDFREWALDGSILDLQEAIKVFQEHELYEHCAIMQKLIDDLAC